MTDIGKHEQPSDTPKLQLRSVPRGEADFDRDATVGELGDAFAILKGEMNKVDLQIMLDMKKVGWLQAAGRLELPVQR